MTDPDLVARLSEAVSLPTDELRQAWAEPGRIAEPVLDVLRRASDGEDLQEPEVNLLFWGLHVLAAVRDTRVYRPLAALLRLDGETLDGLLGGAIQETLASILNSVFDGDPEPLFGLILDSTVDDGVRCELFAVVTCLTRGGSLSRQQAHDLLVRFDDKRAAVEGDEAWFAWEEAIGLLGFRELTARVERVNADGRIPRGHGDLPGFRKLLRDAEARPDDARRFESHRHDILSDPVDALFWTDESANEPVRNPFKHVGRNDPCPCGSGKKFKKCCLDHPPA